MSTNGGDYSRIYFRVKSTTKLGQSLAISGNIYSFGNCNKAKVIPLVTSPEAYPIWYNVSPVIVPKNQIITYKYCLMESGVVKSFEKIGISQNMCKGRRLIANELDVVIEEEFNPLNIEGTGNDSEMDFVDEVKKIQRNVSTDHGEGLLYDLETTQKRVFLVCYHLPVIVKRSITPGEVFDIAWAESLIAKSENSISNILKTIWIGTVSIDSLQLVNGELEILTKQLNALNCFPIFLDSDTARAAYHGFCKQIMWPVFHNVDQLDHIHAAWNLPTASSATTSTAASPSENKTAINWNRNEDTFHAAYQAVNQSFFQQLSHLLEPGDIVWVHDYHLMLLPKLLREYNSAIKIIYFLHIPFPTSQIFRSLSSATELLQSMTCADVVGFHAFDHARHFLNATKRMLGIRSYTRTGGMLTLLVQDREVIVTMSHVSIEPSKLDVALLHPDTLRTASELRAKYKNRKIIVGVDICQRLSGGALKLAAFDKLLSDYIGDKGSVVLVQRNILQGSRKEDEATTSADMRKMVQDINQKYSSSKTEMVVDYEEVQGIKLGLNERLGLWLAADVFLLTPIREGLNLMPLEYIYARKDLPNAGVIVVSEFSTCSSLLNGSLKVNPYSALNVADTLEKALVMPVKDCNYRRQRDLHFVSSHPSAQWTKQIISDLEHLRSAKVPESSSSSLDGTGTHPSLLPLDVRKLVDCYEQASRTGGVKAVGSRVFICDYGGTLLHKEKYDIYIKQTLSAISGRRPTDRMMEAIRRLSEDPMNVVMVVTGLTKLKLGNTFEGMNNVTLVTSNGLVYSWGENVLSAVELIQRKERDELAKTVRPLGGSGSHKVQFQSGTQEEKRSVHSHSNKVKTVAPSFVKVDSPTLTKGASNKYAHLPQNTLEDFSTKQNQQLLQQQTGSTPSQTGGTASQGVSMVDEDKREWRFLHTNIDWGAVSDIALPIITKFTFRTNGTCKSPRIPGIGWSYFGADPDWGEKQATQLKLELEAALAHHDVKVVSLIQGSIEVVPKNLHKGIVVKKLMDRVIGKRGGRLPAFCLILGDEESDDKMFETIHDVLGSVGPESCLKTMKLFTVCVGKRDCPASSYVNRVQDVEDLLDALSTTESTDIAPITSTVVGVETFDFDNVHSEPIMLE